MRTLKWEAVTCIDWKQTVQRRFLGLSRVAKPKLT